MDGIDIFIIVLIIATVGYLFWYKIDMMRLKNESKINDKVIYKKKRK